MPFRFLGDMAYVGSKGTHLLQLSFVNVEDPINGLRPNPKYNQISWRCNIGNNSYNAVALSLSRSFSKGLLMSANYSWSHSIDGSNGSGDVDSMTAQNISCCPWGSLECG